VASFTYLPAKEFLWDGTIDLDTHDIRVLAVMTNSTADTDTTAATISAFGTLDEFDGSGYSRQAATGEAVAQDVPNNRAEFTFGAVTFGTAIVPGTRKLQGLVVFRFITNDADSIPIFYIDLTPAFDPKGTLTYTPHADGVAHLT
jgi:hypothetical protein